MALSKEDMEIVKSVDDVEASHIAHATNDIDRELEKRLVRKIDLRVMPFTALIYLFCYLDRSNIGNAKILNANFHDDLLQTNHMTSYQYTVGLMLFLVAYTLFEAPSNLALKAFKPNRWLGFIICAFGTLCAGIGGTKNFAGIAALRFLLGAAEAGVFPGMVFLMSFWYKPDERATRIAVFLCSATLAGAFGGAIAFGVGHMNRVSGLQGWRWLFILEGVPSVVLGLMVFFFMPNYPENASWLSGEEKELEAKRLGANAARGEAKLSWADAKNTLLELRLWVHYFTYLCLGVGVSSLSLFAPTIVAGLGYKDLRAQLFTVPPYCIAYVTTICVALASDRQKNRGVYAGSCFAIGTVSFIVQACLPGTNYAARYAFLCISTAGVFAGLPPLCAWVSDNVRNTTAASLASGLNIAFTGPGQIIGVWIYRAQDRPFYKLGHAVNAGFLGMGSVLSFSLWFYYTRKNRQLVGTQKLRWVA